ncbi:MAG: hypothetical protein WD875_19660 [Pirellulales bacterium]
MAAPSKYDTDWFTDADELGKKSGLGTRNTPAVDRAIALAEAFGKRPGGGMFKLLERQKIAKGLVKRLNEPNSFDQGSTWLCGIATFVRVWAFDHPVEFVTLAVDLFEKGKGKLVGHGKYGGKTITPSKELRDSPPAKLSNNDDFNHADWIVLASIREAFNDVFNYSADEGVFRIKAWNFPSDVEREFKAAGYTRVINKAANGVGGGGFQNFSEAADLYERDWRVILLINSRLLSAKPEDVASTGVLNTSNHWVGLNSSIVVNTFNNKALVYPFDVYSWNRIHTIPDWKKPIAFATLDVSYFGFVAGKF